MFEWFLGSMGFGYKDWVGVFYPPGISPRDYLAHYSNYFNAVEMDTTFYGTPRRATVEQWKAVTPAEFVFCVKTPRVITHEMGLVGAIGLIVEFVNAMRFLEEKLGVILIQFPPSFTASHAEALEAFLSELIPLSSGVRFAIEFRHSSWYVQATNDLLASYRVCWASTEFPGLPQQVFKTTDFLYLRWIGQHGSYHHHNYERVDKSSDLNAWLECIQDQSSSAQAIYGFFNNDYAGFAAGTCNRFKTIVGLPVKPLLPPSQARLF